MNFTFHAIYRKPVAKTNMLTKGDKPKEQTHAWGHFIQRHLPPGP